jgi:hypothetical protein
MDACCRSLSGSRAWAGLFLDALPGGMAIPGFLAILLGAGTRRLSCLHPGCPGTAHRCLS